MKRIAFFTGAGASKAFEFPLTAEILPRILSRLADGSLLQLHPELSKSLQRFIEGVYPGLLLTFKGDMPLITDILSVLDQAVASESATVCGFAAADLQLVRRAIEQAIFEVMDWFDDYQGGDPKALSKCVEWLRSSHFDSNTQVGLISTNYDTILEHRWFNKKVMTYAEIQENVDFGFPWRDPHVDKIHPRPTSPKSRVYKLHGSFNGLRCPLCDHVYINLDGPIFSIAYERPHEFNQCHCGHAPLQSMIVAPSMVRNVQSSALLETWRNALEFLRVSDLWIIAGYSIPPEDVAIRSLFIRALNGREEWPQILIVQRGAKVDLLCRLLALFPDCKFYADGMENFAGGLDDLGALYQKTPTAREVLKGKIPAMIEQWRAGLRTATDESAARLKEQIAEAEALQGRL